MHASHSCIIVTEPSEVEPVEPTETVEPEPGVSSWSDPKLTKASS